LTEGRETCRWLCRDRYIFQAPAVK